MKISNRQFERQWGTRPVRRGPHFLKEEAGAPSSKNTDNRGIFYERMARVTVFNTFFGPVPVGVSPTFTFQPTPTTAALLADLGLLFTASGVSFSVSCPKHRIPLVAQYLRRQREQDPRKQVWTRLSFLLILNYAYFVNVTDIPIGINPSEQNFYFTNQEAHIPRPGGPVYLNPGDFVTKDQLVPVTGTEYAVATPPTVDRVEVRDISNEIVLCAPRCVPKSVGATKPIELITCEDAIDGRPPFSCRDVVYFDFSTLPEDLYTIREVGIDDLVSDTWPVLYTRLYPMPLCFVDLLLTNPTGDAPGIYPFSSIADPPTLDFVEYQLHFERRSSLWNYYCVPPVGERYEDLVIESDRYVFRGPREVILGDGRLAYAFRSEEVIPLEAQSSVRLTLRGRPRSAKRPRILVDRLPVASGPLVQPGDIHEPRAHSDIFVYL